MTKLAYIGNFGPAHSTENHYARSFEVLGVDVDRIQENEPDALARANATDADVLLYTRTWGLDLAESWNVFRALEARDVVTAAVHLDTWDGLDREAEVVTQSMFRVRHFFTADGDAADLWDRAGVNWHWLPPGVLADEAVDLSPFPRDQYPWDVAFVGSRGYHHEWPHRPELVDRLRGWYGDRFIHVGGDGDVLSLLGVGNGTALRGENLNRFYRTVPVIVGDSLGAYPEATYWSDRFTETYGRGGLLVFPEIVALTEMLGVEYPWWPIGEWDALRSRVDEMLALAPEGREVIRRQVASEVRAHHTYTQRAAEILDVLGVTR